jgi:hypothetical protein
MVMGNGLLISLGKAVVVSKLQRQKEADEMATWLPDRQCKANLFDGVGKVWWEIRMHRPFICTENNLICSMISTPTFCFRVPLAFD